MKKNILLSSALSLCLLTSVSILQATNVGLWPIPMVTVGDAGNEAIPNTTNTPPNFLYTSGTVNTNYQIGEYTITCGEYCDFLNHVAASDPYGCYDTNMGRLLGTNTDGTTNAYIATILRSGTNGTYVYYLIHTNESDSNLPIVYLDWLKAERFCNWMYHYCTNAPEGNNSTEQGSYTLNGTMNLYVPVITANTNATWLIPSDSQWRKAAFYKGGSTNAGYWLYPTQSDEPPGNTIDDTNIGATDANWLNGSSNYATTGTVYSNSYLTPVGLFTNSPGPYGTYDMGGNVFELIDHNWSYWKTIETLGGSYNTSASGFLELNNDNNYVNRFPALWKTGFRICAPTSTVSSNYIPQ